MMVATDIVQTHSAIPHPVNGCPACGCVLATAWGRLVVVRDDPATNENAEDAPAAEPVPRPAAEALWTLVVLAMLLAAVAAWRLP